MNPISRRTLVAGGAGLAALARPAIAQARYPSRPMQMIVPWGAGGGTDAFGHSQLGGVASYLAGKVKAELGYKVHWTLPDYLQRSARHIASKTDWEQAQAAGKAAVQFALKGMNAVMPVIVRSSDAPYRWKIEAAPLSKIANHEKKMPPAFLRKDGFGITEKARRYLQPLIRGEAYPPYDRNGGLPKYVALKNVAVKKKLPAWEG